MSIAYNEEPLPSSERYKDNIDTFRGNYNWLSNFYKSPLKIEGLIFPTLEHAYQSRKTRLRRHHVTFTDENMTAAQAKWAGAKLILRPDWEESKLAVMEHLLTLKFDIVLNKTLAMKLVSTGTRGIVHENSHGDYFWGTVRGRGENHLGTLLMDIRNKLNSFTKEVDID